MVTALEPEIVFPKNMNEVPKELFVREDLFDLEIEKIFKGPEWHIVAHASEMPNPGDFKTFSVGLVPLLIARGQDDEIRVFYNACSHRGNQIETQTHGNRNKFSCPYHRWMFSTEGDLIGTPPTEKYVPGFEKKDYPLTQPRTAVYCGLVFVTLSKDAPPLEEWMGDVKHTIRDALGEGNLKLLGYQKVSFKANWKAVADNDGYHAPLLHKAFQMLNWQGGAGRQYIATDRGHIGYEGEVKPVGETKLVRDRSIIDFSADDEFAGGSRLVSLYPISGVVKHLDLINIRFTIVNGVEDTETHYAYFSREGDSEEMVRQRIRQSSNLMGPCGMVSMEDASIFHRIHIGSYTPGNAIFQQGVKSVDTLETEFAQNDETGNLPRWEYYRKQLGLRRASA